MKDCNNLTITSVRQVRLSTSLLQSGPLEWGRLRPTSYRWPHSLLEVALPNKAMWLPSLKNGIRALKRCGKGSSDDGQIAHILVRYRLDSAARPTVPESFSSAWFTKSRILALLYGIEPRELLINGPMWEKWSRPTVLQCGDIGDAVKHVPDICFQDLRCHFLYCGPSWLRCKWPICDVWLCYSALW